MATRSEDVFETDRLREVVRLLKLALENCQRLLAQAERDVLMSKQDNDPR